MASFLGQSLTLLRISNALRRCASLPMSTPSKAFLLLSQRLGVNTIPRQLRELVRIVQEKTLGLHDNATDVVPYLAKQVGKKNRERPVWNRLLRWVSFPIKPYDSRHVKQKRSANPQLLPTKNFLAHSESRIGELWRVEDHELLLRKLAEVDELCVAVWQRIANLRNRRTSEL